MDETQVIRVRYWAAARAAAGVAEDEVVVSGPISLVDLRERILATRTDPRFADLVGVCSVLVGDRPVSAADPATVQVVPGDVVEFLPPFAGG